MSTASCCVSNLTESVIMWEISGNYMFFFSDMRWEVLILLWLKRWKLERSCSALITNQKWDAPSLFLLPESPWKQGCSNQTVNCERKHFQFSVLVMWRQPVHESWRTNIELNPSVGSSQLLNAENNQLCRTFEGSAHVLVVVLATIRLSLLCWCVILL